LIYGHFEHLIELRVEAEEVEPHPQ